MNIDNAKFVAYRTKKGNIIKTLKGINGRSGYLFKYVSFNNFETTETKIPTGYKKVTLDQKVISRLYFDPTKTLLTKNNDRYKIIKSKIPSGTKSYITHNNGDRPYLVYVSKNTKLTDVIIYEMDNDNHYITDKDFYGPNNKWTYINKVASYKVIDAWIANGYNLDHLGKYNAKLDVWTDNFAVGNSVIAKITNDKYVFIGDKIKEFKLEKNDKIINYYSPIGRNDVPYPVIIGLVNVYFLIDFKYVPIKEFESFTKKDQINAYLHFYGQNDWKNKLNHKKMKLSN